MCAATRFQFHLYIQRHRGQSGFESLRLCYSTKEKELWSRDGYGPEKTLRPHTSHAGPERSDASRCDVALFDAELCQFEWAPEHMMAYERVHVRLRMPEIRCQQGRTRRLDGTTRRDKLAGKKLAKIAAT